MSEGQQKSIFVTGAAGGMGRAVAQRFAAAGWFVGLYDLDTQGLEVTAALLPAGQFVSGELDVTSETAFTEAAGAFGARTAGRCDVLFNNAGIAPGGSFGDMPLAQLEQIVRINVMGVIIGTRALLPLLQETPGALCISTSSSVAIYGHAGRAVYSASKAAVKNLTEALDLEFESLDIRTADVLPGCIDTPMLRGALAASNDGVFHESMLDHLPKEGPYRLIEVSAIADAVWQAYADPGANSGPLHWYVPPELEAIEAMSPAEARQETRRFLFRE